MSVKKHDIYSIFFEEGEVTELRAFGLQGKGSWDGWARDIVFGYFNGGTQLEAAVKALEKHNPTSIYFVANPVTPSLLARANNRLIAYKDKVPLTKNREIVCFRWALIDLDPRRPTGIPSSNEERTAAYRLALDIAVYVKNKGGKLNIFASSGNGFHLWLKCDPSICLEPHDDEAIQRATAPIRNFLAHLGDRFSNDDVEVDAGTYKPVQLARYYGTYNRKGDGTPDRPHRRSEIIKVRG